MCVSLDVMMTFRLAQQSFCPPSSPLCRLHQGWRAQPETRGQILALKMFFFKLLQNGLALLENTHPKENKHIADTVLTSSQRVFDASLWEFSLPKLISKQLHLVV